MIHVWLFTEIVCDVSQAGVMFAGLDVRQILYIT